MENFEEKVTKLEAIQEINDCLTRYCRAMDWVDEDLLKTCFLESGYIDYGFYAGDAKGFIPVVMEIEKSGHSWHTITNVAVELKGNKAEVESYGLTAGGEIENNSIKNINIFFGRYHDEFTDTSDGWKISKRLYILDSNFSTEAENVSGALEGLFLGMNLRTDSEKYRKLYNGN